MSFLCSSIAEERDKYLEDLNAISNAFLTCMKNLPDEDPQLSSIITGFTHLSLAMKDKFSPILDQILPKLTEYINTNIDISATDAAFDEYIPALATSIICLPISIYILKQCFMMLTVDIWQMIVGVLIVAVNLVCAHKMTKWRL